MVVVVLRFGQAEKVDLRAASGPGSISLDLDVGAMSRVSSSGEHLLDFNFKSAQSEDLCGKSNPNHIDGVVSITKRLCAAFCCCT